LGRSTNPYVIAIGVICTVAGGFPIFHEAYENITQRRMTMELSMAIAIVAALAIREIFTALVITLFVLAAEILEGLTVGRGRKAKSAAPRRNKPRTQQYPVTPTNPSNQGFIFPSGNRFLFLQSSSRDG
jgi:cation transport ATPase